MNSTKRIALLTGALSLALSAVTATAQPNDHPGNSKNKAERGQAPAQQYHRHHGPSVDIGAVRITLRNHRDLLAPASSPPAFRRTWRVASHCRQASPRTWTIACSAICHATKAMNGSSWGVT